MWAFVSVAALLVLALPLGAAPLFRNTVNNPFATRCNGPQGAIVVARSRAVSAASVTAVHKALLNQHSARGLRSAMATYQRILRLRLKKKPGQVRFPRVMVETLNGKLVQPNLVRTRQVGGTIGAPTNDLTFQFQGFSSSDEAALRSYLDGAYPKAKLIYGPPAFSNTVTIIQDDTISAVQGGTYDPATNEIRIPTLTGNFPEDTYILLLLVLNAFHDDAALYYDSWEQGMAGAAAWAIQMTPGVSPGYDVSNPGPFYAMPVYEAENQPELGNSTFYPASGATNMLAWRVAMARCAWHKCWIEDPNFFARFNAAYYVSYSDALPGDIPGLKEVAASALPMVEGTPFVEWYEHQYALDTSVHVGQKLYTWNIPFPQMVGLFVELYQTLADGDERPSSGQATTIYWDYTKQTQLYAEEGNSINIPAGGDTPGEGALSPTFFNIGGPQRITVQIDVAGLRGNYIYPYGVRGDDPVTDRSQNNLYGAIIGSDAGTTNVTGGDGITDLAVDRGVWGARITSRDRDLSGLKLQMTYQPTGGQPFTRNINVGWYDYLCLMQAGAQATLDHTFTYDANGLYLMSLPLQPQTNDMAGVLGIPASQLLLAWWDPNFVGDNKYRLWPSYPTQGLGSAYWLRVLSDTPVHLTGLQADPAVPYQVTIGGGWNLLGCPRTTAVALADVLVQQGDADPVTWADAVSQHLVQDGLYGYSQSTGYELKDTLQPWCGYWMRCLVPNGVTLIFPAQTQTTAAGRPKVAMQR